MTSTSADVENKVILITGGAQGIGGAAARLCAQRGAEVIITDIKDETGEALAASLRAEGLQGPLCNTGRAPPRARAACVR